MLIAPRIAPKPVDRRGRHSSSELPADEGQGLCGHTAGASHAFDLGRAEDLDRHRSFVPQPTAISYKANRMIGGSAPSNYLAQLQGHAQMKLDDAAMDTILKSHVIDPALLRGDSFQAFYAEGGFDGPCRTRDGQGVGRGHRHRR